MYDRFKNQYIFKLSNGKTINYYFKENTGICASSINRRNLWSDSVILAKDSFRGFSADIDNNDKINILYQDTKGNLYAIRYSNTQYKTYKLLTSKNVTTYDKQLKIISPNDTIFCLYVVEHNGNKLLSYQSSNRDLIFSNPKVIDICSESLLPYTAFLDSKGMIVVFYFCEDTKRRNPGIRTINCENDSVGDFIAVSDYSAGALILGGFCDLEGNYNLLWERKKEDNYELCYSCKFKDKEKFETEKIINTSVLSHVNASIIEKNNVLICYWVMSETVYYSVTLDKKHFSNPEIYKQLEGRQYHCITYKENASGRLSGNNPETLPVNFSNGIRLAFSDINLDRSLENNQSILQAYNSRERLDQIDSKYKTLSEKIDTLEKKLVQYDLDIQKAIIRINQLESDLNKKFKLSKARINENEVHVNKATTNIDENVMEKFKYLENNFSDNDFVQDPKIEEIKKQIALQSKNIQKNDGTNDLMDASEPVGNTKTKVSNNTPIMQGTGFSGITAEYLKNLGKKHD